jgi:predicted nuclease with TOPRIM domain
MDSIGAKVMELDARQRTSEHRIKDLESEVHDLRELTKAVAVTNESVHQLKDRVEELHTDVKSLSAAPGKRWEAVVLAIVTAVVGAIAGAVFALVLK